MIYLDQAATSFPKPSEVVEAVAHTLRNIPGSPGRSAHKGALAASRVLFEARERVAAFIGAEDSSEVIFTSGATEALNIVLKGFLKKGDTVVATSMEHNAVARILKTLRHQGVNVLYAPCDQEGFLLLEELEKIIRTKNPKLLCINLVSNVTGTIQPLAEIYPLKGEETYLLVDAAQAAGHLPLEVANSAIDFLAFSGHKGLFGPPGVGVLYLRRELASHISPLKEGGTGSRSESLFQPEFLPDRFESGTPNLPGIAGLAAGIDFVEKIGLTRLHRHETALADIFLEKIRDHPRIKIYGPKDRVRATAIVSVNVEGLPPSEVARRLDIEFDIAVRPGLHCAPLAHQTIGTFPQGTVRFSFGYFNRLNEAEKAAEALIKIAS